MKALSALHIKELAKVRRIVSHISFINNNERKTIDAMFNGGVGKVAS